jgi:hypothetical protein
VLAGSIHQQYRGGVRQGLSGCRKEPPSKSATNPFNNTGADLIVTISGKYGEQSTRRTESPPTGRSRRRSAGNVVTGDGPIAYIAQNGIQVGFGATRTVKNNTVSGNNYYAGERRARAEFCSTRQMA